MTWELNPSKSNRDNSYVLFCDDFDVFLEVSGSLSLLRRQTSILRYEWRENSTFQKVAETTHTSCFTMILTSPVLSPSKNLVGRTTSFLRYEWLKNLIFQDFRKTSDTSYFMMNLMPLVHSGSLSRLRRKTTFARYVWHENSALQKVLEITVTSGLAMCSTPN